MLPSFPTRRSPDLACRNRCSRLTRHAKGPTLLGACHDFPPPPQGVAKSAGTRAGRARRRRGDRRRRGEFRGGTSGARSGRRRRAGRAGDRRRAGAAVASFAAGRPALGADVAEELVVLVIVGALARRFGIALPGNGFTSYILGVMAYATLDRGWPFGVFVGPVAMLVGDMALRRLPLAAALGNAAHLAAGGAVAGLVYERLGGATGAAALAAVNLPGLVIFLALLPLVVNATFYVELALGRSLAWVDPRMTARWEAVVYACSAGLALGWLALLHAGVDSAVFAVVGAGLAGATAATLSVVRRGVRADELALIQGLGQAIARDISLAKSFPRIQELARRLDPRK